MTGPLGVFDRWAASGPFSALDLSRYRVLYGLWGLWSLPAFHVAASFPQSAYRPLRGPSGWLSGFPSPAVMWTIELLLATGLAALVVNVRVRLASVVVSLCYLAGFGVRYSLGKIDHDTILLILVPLALAFAWGERPSTPVAQWPMRLLACIVGVGMFSAARPKFDSGWLDTDTQAAAGHFVVNYFQHERDRLLAPLGLRVTSTPLWEVIDWLTVFAEGIVIIAALRWSWFRISVAVLAVFHLAVWLVFNIDYFNNVVVYAAFVSWGSLTLPAPLVDAVRRLRAVPVPRWVWLGALVVATRAVHAPDWASGLGVAVGGVCGICYIVTRAWSGALRLHKRGQVQTVTSALR